MGRPYVTVFVTMSADGKISSSVGESRLSCPYDKKRLHILRATNDAVMIGANTAITDNPSLTVRYINGSNPVRVLVDGLLKAPLDLKLFNIQEAPTVVLTSPRAPKEKVRSLESKGVKVIVIRSTGAGISMNEGLRKLHDLGIKSLLVEGGGNVIWSLFKERLVDEFRVTVSPYIIGGEKSITPVEGKGFPTLEDWIKLKLINYFVCECGQEIHLIYKVINHYTHYEF